MGSLSEWRSLLEFLGVVTLLPFATTSNIATTFSKKLIILLPPSAAFDRHNFTLSFMIIMIIIMVIDLLLENSRVWAVQLHFFCELFAISVQLLIRSKCAAGMGFFHFLP
jgi:hypothetical protein